MAEYNNFSAPAPAEPAKKGWQPPVKYRHSVSWIGSDTGPSGSVDYPPPMDIYSNFGAYSQVSEMMGPPRINIRYFGVKIDIDGAEGVVIGREEIKATPAEMPRGAVVKVTKTVTHDDGEDTCSDPECCGGSCTYETQEVSLYVRDLNKASRGVWRQISGYRAEDTKMTDEEMAAESWEFVRALGDDLR